MLFPQSKAIFKKRLFEARFSILFYFVNFLFVLVFAGILIAIAPILISSASPPSSSGIQLRFQPTLLSLTRIFTQYASVALVGLPGLSDDAPFGSGVHVTRFKALSDIPKNSPQFPTPFNLAFVANDTSTVAVYTPNGMPSVLFGAVSNTEVALAGAAQFLPSSAPPIMVSPYPQMYFNPSSSSAINLFAAVAPLFVGFSSAIFVACIASISARDLGDGAAKLFLYRLCLRPLAYHLGNGAFDCVLAVLVLFAGLSIMLGAANLFNSAWLFAALFVNAFACVLFAYCITLRFKLQETAARWLYPLNLGMMLVSAPITIFLIPTLWEQWYIVSGPLALVFPPAAVTSTLTNLAIFQGCNVAIVGPESCPSIVGTAVQFVFQLLSLASLSALLWLSENGLQRAQPSGNELNFESAAPIQTRNLHLSYEYVKTRGTGCCRRIKGRKQALASISLAVKKHSIYAVLGANGAGKTSLFRVLAGEQRVDSGSATIFGLDTVEDRQKIRERVSFMEQEDILLEFLTVEQFLNVICDVRGIEYHLIDKYLPVMDLQAFRNAILTTLSGGQRRKGIHDIYVHVFFFFF